VGLDRLGERAQVIGLAEAQRAVEQAAIDPALQRFCRNWRVGEGEHFAAAESRLDEEMMEHFVVRWSGSWLYFHPS
jgi:hypothetical protein